MTNLSSNPQFISSSCFIQAVLLILENYWLRSILPLPSWVKHVLSLGSGLLFSICSCGIVKFRSLWLLKGKSLFAHIFYSVELNVSGIMHFNIICRDPLLPFIHIGHHGDLIRSILKQLVVFCVIYNHVTPMRTQVPKSQLLGFFWLGHHPVGYSEKDWYPGMNSIEPHFF